MWYTEIEASLGISSTSIHSILHEHLAVKKICSRWIPHNLTIAAKEVRVDFCKEMLQNTRCFKIRFWDHHRWRIMIRNMSLIYAFEPERKQQSTVWVGLRKRAKSSESCSWKQMLSYSSAKLIMWRLFHLSIVGRSILSGAARFVWLKSTQKFEKQTTEDESLFTMTMRVLIHRLKAASFWTAFLNDLTPNDFFLFPHIILLIDVTLG